MDTQSSEKSHTSVSARRRLFQILAVGGTAAVVLPEKWVKPVVDAVIVPAHASGSVVRAQGIFGNQGTLFVASNRMNPLERLAEMFVGSAHAVQSCTLTNVTCISFVIPAPTDSTVQVRVGSSSTTTLISSNNAIGDVNNLGGMSFTNLIASSTSISGYFSDSNSNCFSTAFTLPRRLTDVCASPT